MKEEADSYYIAEAQSGNVATIGTLAKRHSDRLYAMLITMLQDSDEVQDLMQEIWLKVIRRIGQFRAESKFETWLYRIAYNEAIDLLRRKKKAPVELDETQLSDTELDSDDEAEEQAYRVEALEAAMAKLPAADRMLLTLFYYEDRSLAEIALIVAQSEGNCKVRLHRLRKKLYKLMQEDENRR